MLNRAPSVKRLADFYPKMDRPTILKVRQLLVWVANPREDPEYDEHRHDSFRRDKRLQEVSDLVGAHGVEYLAVQGDVYGREGISYVNEGDTYTPTVLYDAATDTIRLQSWGDAVEIYERRGRRF